MRERDRTTQDSVTKEMAKPRMSKSARIAELSLDTARVPEQPSISVPGTVKKIIPSSRPVLSEKAEIAVEGGGISSRTFRVENALTDEHGDDVKLKKGTRVQVTVEANDVKSVRQPD
jgi:hypothetical protein